MGSLWEVIGGIDSGGILVREGRDLKSALAPQRLAHGALVQEIALEGDRLNYELVEGTGPGLGWVSLHVKGKRLLTQKEPRPEVDAGPGEAQGIEDDGALKKRILELHQAKLDQGAFDRYLPKYKAFGYPLQEPKLRVFCFHGSGSAESMYTQKGTPFLEWAKQSRVVEVCALDYPGRNRLLHADKITSARRLAEEALAVCYAKLTDGVPYAVWAHAVGTWVAFEFLILARRIGLSMPRAAFLIAFPAPHVPERKRTWRRNRSLSDQQFKDEVKSWDVLHFHGAGAIVFDTKDWATSWKPLLRADFTLFDEYRFVHDDIPKFSFPIYAWHMSDEYYFPAEQVEMWRDWTTGVFDFQVLDFMGPFTCIYMSDQKEDYYGRVADILKKLSGNWKQQQQPLDTPADGFGGCDGDGTQSDDTEVIDVDAGLPPIVPEVIDVEFTAWQTMSVSRLLAECRIRMLSTDGCVERDDLVALLFRARIQQAQE